ncbi:unnamed protein product [Orchesella dallaii]|uniref:C2H2-type domain-containing protein n=1 Tax=Orchesella dallaii TaxID=48710 RepID=A0ABP1S2B1_9HEXA
MDVSKFNINNLLNVSDSSDSGTSTLMFTRSSVESSPSSSASLSLVCLEDQSASERSQTSSSMDDLYFVPAKFQEAADRSFDNISIEAMIQLPSEVGIESQEIVRAYTPVKLQTSEDCERTPNGMPKLSPVLEAAKKVFPRSSFQSRRPKQLIMCMKRKRSGGFRKTGIKKIIEAAVKKELKGLESRITQSISSTIKEEVLSVVQQQLKESLGGFRGPVESGVQKTRSTRSKARSKGHKAGNNEKMQEIELESGNSVEAVKAVAASGAVEGRTTSVETEKLQKLEEESEETNTPSPTKPSTAFGALLKYVHSKTLLEKLTASMEKNSKDEDDQDNNSDSSFESAENNVLVKDVPSCVPKMVSVDSLKDSSPSSSRESSPDKENQNNASSIPKTSTTPAQPVLNIAKPTGRITWNNTCKALVPYVRTSSVATKIIIGLPKSNPELASKHELAIRKYKEPLACDFCGKHFYNNSSLKQHTSFHRPHRPYQCEHINCNKAYKTRSELNRHLVVHSGEKNFECRQCGKRFLRKQYLKTHLLRHEEALIWNCNLCSKMFVTQHDLDKHKVSYHKNGKRAQRVEEELPQRLALTYSNADLRA